MTAIPLAGRARGIACLLAGAAVSTFQAGCVDVRSKLMREVAAAGLPAGPGGPPELVSEEEIRSLPAPVRRYLAFMGAVGAPRVWSFRAGFEGQFRRAPDQAWRRIEAWQYNTRLDVARYFYLRLPIFGLPVLGRDVYARGQGRMLIRPLDLFTVQDAKGEALDIGELVTYLNDAIVFAPAMVLGPSTTWRAIDDRSFDVALTDRGRTVTARVTIDERGAPVDFTTTDRFVEDPHAPGHPFVRARWSTPLSGWLEVGGRKVMASGRAIWHLPEGDFAYAALRTIPESVAFDVPPGR